MKLGQIVMARESFQRLSTLRMPPQTAYRLLKYLKLVTAESEVIERQRINLLRDVSGTKDGEDVNLAPGTPEHTRFLVEYSAALETESDLKPFDMMMDALLATLEAEKGNVLSAADLAAVEPFFEA